MDELNPQNIKRLESMHTRKLIKLLRLTYKSGDIWWDRYEAETYGFSTKEIKAVLQTREHIRNKLEGELFRKERAKTSKNARNNRCVMRHR